MKTRTRSSLRRLPPLFAVAALLGACSTVPPAGPPAGPDPLSRVDRLEIVQDAPRLGEPHRVTVLALDASGRPLDVPPAALRWSVDDPDVLRPDAPGVFTPLRLGLTVLRVATPDGRAFSEYPEAVLAPPGEEAPPGDPVLGDLSAPGHSYAELNTNWAAYVGATLNRFGDRCQGGADDCGQCVGFAKAFANNTPYNVSSKSWFSGGRVLTRGFHPRLDVALAPGDAIATMEPWGGTLRYSLADYSGPGHVALFSLFRFDDDGVYVAVRDSNYVAPLRVGYHTLSVPKVNGVPYCSPVRSSDPSNVCNYDKVRVD